MKSSIKKIDKNNFENNKDFFEIIGLEREIFGESAYSEKDYVELLCYSNIEIFYLEDKEEIVSYLTILTTVDSIDILKIATKSGYRRKKFAKKLINSLVETKSQRDILLEVRAGNETAINFYRVNNFKKIFVRKKYYSDTNEDAVIMKMEREA